MSVPVSPTPTVPVDASSLDLLEAAIRGDEGLSPQRLFEFWSGYEPTRSHPDGHGSDALGNPCEFFRYDGVLLDWTAVTTALIAEIRRLRSIHDDR